MTTDSETEDLSARADVDAKVAPTGNRRLRLFLMVLLPLIAILVALYFYLHSGRYVSTENAYVKSNVIAISSDISGRVAQVLVSDNQSVRQGDLLFELDAETMELDVMQARAQMDVARAEIETLRAEHSEARVSVDEANARVEHFRREFERQKIVKKQGIGSGQAYDEAQFELRAARQRVTVLIERMRRSLATFNGDADLPVEKHPLFMQASVAHDMALSQLDKTTVVAPADGVVSNLRLQAGEYLDAGNAAFSLIESTPVWVEANLKETQLTHVQEGQQVTLTVDAYPDFEWQATVSSIAPATGAEFTLLPPQNATGNWVKVVQRVPVNLQVHTHEDAPVLRAGMTVSVRIDTEHQRQALSFLKSFWPSEANADAVISNSETGDQSVHIFKQQVLINSESPAKDATPAAVGAINQSTSIATIDAQAPEKYTIEVLRADDIYSLETVMSELPLDTAVMVYRLQSELASNSKFGLATGLFDNRQQADRQLARLPGDLKRHEPTVRKVVDIQRLLAHDD